MSKLTIHRTAIVDEGAQIGEGTFIWHWAHICGKAKIGKDCSFGQNVFVGNDVIIGNAAANTLTGGAGDDSFVFTYSTLLNSGTVATVNTATWNMDTITDFGTGSDGLTFDATAFTNGGLSAGAALGAGEFISGTTIDATSADGTSIFMLLFAFKNIPHSRSANLTLE